MHPQNSLLASKNLSHEFPGMVPLYLTAYDDFLSCGLV